MNVALRADREGDHATLVPTGAFDLAHATAVTQAVTNAETSLSGCCSIDVDLTQLDRIDGAGAVLLGINIAPHQALAQGDPVTDDFTGLIGL